uniref:Putative neurotoxin LTDF 12-03 n=1 Tax=Dolomedes fimbriatus TaxID=1432569 RepID=A0A0K1D8F0_9ARAC|nr:putative neurotoxin LTDF 12-03 [Dolomedes fimbriatus]
MSFTLRIVLVTFFLVACDSSDGSGYCPDFTVKICSYKYKINDCCAQADCPAGAVCCVQPCGNVCRREYGTPIGEPFVDGTDCKLGHVYPEKWYQKLWHGISG